MQDNGSFLRDVKRNLLSLEINTILKDNMTAEPMPSIPHAILDIAGEYVRKLERLGVNVTGFFTVTGRSDPFANAGVTKPEMSNERERFRPASGLWREPGADRFNTDLLTVSTETFDRLRWAAKAAGVEAGGSLMPVSDSDLIIVERICNNCDAIKTMMERTQSLEAGKDGPLNRASLLRRADAGAELFRDMTGSDYLVIRKIWEVGTEDVVAQTVIQLDGDVVTRLREVYLNHPGAPTLLRIHELGIGVSVSSWRHLIAIVQEIAEGTFKAFRRVF